MYPIWKYNRNNVKINKDIFISNNFELNFA